MSARWLLIPLLLLVLAGCGGEQPAAPSEPEPTEPEPEADDEAGSTDVIAALALGFPIPPVEAEGLEVSLTPSQERLAFGVRSTLSFTLQITNRGSTPVTDLPLTGRWLINGALDNHVAMTFQNGSREGDWERLEPGQSVSVTRSFGEEVFVRPGPWVMTYEHGDLRGEARVLLIADQTAERGLAWWLEAEPADLTMDQRESFRLRLRVENTGPRVTPPEEHRGQWLVNAEPATGIDLAFSNGLREAAWSSLAPGDAASMERALGESLFEAPGYYEIRYRREDGTDAGVTVTVRRNRDDAIPR